MTLSNTNTFNDEIHKLIEHADMAFWTVIANHFPESTTGDLSIDRTCRLAAAQSNAVREWISTNVPLRPAHIVPGLRFQLRIDVDRLPDFLAPAGMTGTITFVDEHGVWAEMDQHLDGAEHWDNEIHWESNDVFVVDV
jgi:hypothetical protein